MNKWGGPFHTASSRKTSGDAHWVKRYSKVFWSIAILCAFALFCVVYAGRTFFTQSGKGTSQLAAGPVADNSRVRARAVGERRENEPRVSPKTAAGRTASPTPWSMPSETAIAAVGSPSSPTAASLRSARSGIEGPNTPLAAERNANLAGGVLSQPVLAGMAPRSFATPSPPITPAAPKTPDAPPTSPSAPPKTPDAHPDPASDTSPPILLSLQFVPPQIHDGEEAAVVMNVTDDLSGVESVMGILRSPSGKAPIGFAGQREGETDQWVAKVRIPNGAESGAWFVSGMALRDKANNTSDANYSPSTVPQSWNLIVLSSSSDSTPPTLRAIWLEKPSVRELEKETIWVQADDDNSGVAEVSGSFQSPSGAAIISFGCRWMPDSGAWVGEFLVPKGADCGDWTIHQVQLVDKARNIASIGAGSPVLGRLSFNVSRADECDSTPPVLQSLDLSPRLVSNEDQSQIVVTAAVTDEGTGVRSVSGRADGPITGGGTTPNVNFSCQKQGSEPSGQWVGKIVVPKFSAKGTWRVSWVQVQDGANNRRVYSLNDPVLASATFEVR